MILSDKEKSPSIDATAMVAPTATICGNVVVGPGVRIMHGASVIAEGGSIELGRNCIVFEHAVIRSTAKCSTTIKECCLIGPNTHLVGCTIEENVFIATGASVFHDAWIERDSEVRINGVVHVRSKLPANSIVPIAWVAVGNPAEILSPDDEYKIWERLEPLDFPKVVYGVDRPRDRPNNMEEITQHLSELYGTHLRGLKAE